MNTFYGEAGNSKSPIFLRELAGGTTLAGKFSLNLVTEFVTKKGFGINMEIPILCISPAQISIMKNAIKPSPEKNFLKKHTGPKWSKLL